MNVDAVVNVTSYQAEFLETDYFLNEHRILRDSTNPQKALVGGFGTGKTHSLCLKIIQQIQFRTKQGIKHVGITTAPVHSHFVDVLVPQLTDLLDLYHYDYNYNHTHKIFFINLGGFEHLLYLKSGEQAKAGKLVGINATDCYHDEFDVNSDEVQKHLYESTEERLRDCKDPTQSFATTPEKLGYLHWLCVRSAYEDLNGKKHEKEKEPKVKYIKARTVDNVFLADPEGYSRKLLEIYTPKQAKAYLEGEFANLIGDRVWEYFNEDIHVFDELGASGSIVSFWDFGYNDYTYCGFASIDSVGGVNNDVRILDEFKIRKATLETVFTYYFELCRKYGQPIADYCDPAGNQHHLGAKMGLSVIEQMRANGLNPRWQKSNIIEGIIIGNNMFHKNKIKVDSNCKNFINMLIHSSYEKNKNGVISEKPIHGEHEAPEAGFRYLMVNEFRNSRENWRIQR